MTEKWGITKKEEKENGLRIESVDTFDVKKQLMDKYRVNSMMELKNLLKEKAEEREKRMAV